MGKPIADITGERFGRLVAIERVGSRRYKGGGTLSIWKCRCDCGNYTEIPLCALKNGNTKSCGCLVDKGRLGDLKRTHGEAHSRLYNVWQQMRKRCNNPHDTVYKYYGGKGVSVCDEWSSYEVFREWAYKNGYDPDAPRGYCTLDRINPFLDYSPDNCRWVPFSEQLKNTRKEWTQRGCTD